LTKTYASVAVLAQKTALLALFPKTTVFTKSTLILASIAAHAKAHAPLALPNRRNCISQTKNNPVKPGLFFVYKIPIFADNKHKEKSGGFYEQNNACSAWRRLELL
jgi:hypothetical protein